MSGLRFPGLLLEIGLGGFVDGILLHQILQWRASLVLGGALLAGRWRPRGG